MFPSKFPGSVNNLELYPRRRKTEFYWEPQPQPEYQSRMAEHAVDKLRHNVDYKPIQGRIGPPSNSAMRVYRDSYFT
ncbi:uncharacterized protein ACN427_006276 [Glossina fuscipes fuscipes]